MIFIQIVTWTAFIILSMFYISKPIPAFIFVLSLCEIAFGGLSYDDEQKLDESVHQRNFEIKVEAKDQEGKVLRWT